MIKVENIVGPSPEQWEIIVKGIRNPMNSWDKSDSILMYGQSYEGWTFEEDLNGELVTVFDLKAKKIKEGKTLKFSDQIEIEPQYFWLGDNDLKLMWNLANAGPDHGKFLRQLPVICEITAPLYWFKQFDTYKVGTTSNSCSTMHRLTEKPFELSDFSIQNDVWIEQKYQDDFELGYAFEDIHLIDYFEDLITKLNNLRNRYLETKDKRYWQAIVELLPESYNQKRTVSLNYAVLRNMYQQRKNHKLSEWHEFLEQMIESLPYAKELICGE